MSWITRALSWVGVDVNEPSESRARTLHEVDFWLRDDVWGSTTTDAGISVTEATAVAVPDVFACLQVISTDVARCPIKYQQRTPDGEWYDAEGHEFWDLLAWLPNPETSAFEFWAPLVRDVQIYSKAYAEIVRRGTGEPYQLWRLDPSRISITRNGLNQKVYQYKSASGQVERSWVFNAERPPLLELTAWSWVQQCRDLIGSAMALDRYGAKYFANAARPSGVLATPQTLSDQARARLEASWARTYGGSQNAHKTAVLEAGLEFKPISVPNNEAQFIEARRFLTERICGVAGVPPHKVAELSRSTNNNIEQQSRDYIERLSPYFVLIEQAIRRDLLTSRTWPRYRAVFDREALVQTDMQSLASAYATFRQNGIYSANDCRRKLHENPIEAAGGDLYHMNGNMVPLTGAPVAPGAPLSTPTPAPVEESV
jgi:HK97 family phage portal protein